MPDITLKAKDVELKLDGFYLKIDKLSVKTGERVCLYGPNGSGKTTLCKILTGFIKPEKGSIKLFGRSLSELNSKERAGLINYTCFDTSVAYVDKILIDFVKLGAYVRRSANGIESEVIDVLKLLGLESKKEQVVSTLSAGELQRAIIAQSLIQRSKIMIFDEPTAHLDIYWQHRLINDINQYAKDFLKTGIFVLHDLNLAINNFDRLICMNEGKVQADLELDSPEKKFKAIEIIGNLYSIKIDVTQHKRKVIGVYF
ncbi:MAG: ABC transporter ATP-binding protein [Actinobacteria bacterium]|nr:ABC transporter ATP-binding protein [Actinomycetota bacterium]